MEKRFFERLYDSINYSLNYLYVNNDNNKMSNNKQSMNWRELFLTTSWSKKGMFKAFTFLTGFFLIVSVIGILFYLIYNF